MVNYSLHDHTYDGQREENSHLAFAPFKEEIPSGDYSLESPIKEEDVEPTDAGGTENEGPRINQVFSAGEMPEKDENKVILDLSLDNDLQGAQNQSSEPEHPPVITANNVTDDKISEEQPLMTAQKQSVVELEKEQQIAVPRRCGQMSINYQTVPQQECGVHCIREQIMGPTTQNKQITFEEVRNAMSEGDGISQPVRRKRGRPPKKAKRVHRPVKHKQNLLSTDSVRLEQVDVPSFVNTANTTIPRSPRKKTYQYCLTSIAPSVQERPDTFFKDMENIEVGSLPSSVSSLIGGFSFEKLSGSQQIMEEEAFKHRERCSSVTLQDAMLMVEAMNQRLAPSPYTQNAPQLETSQTVDNIPAEPETLPLPTEVPMATSSLPITEPSTKQSPVQTPSPTPQVTNSTHTTKAQIHVKAAIPELPMVTPSDITEAQTQIKAAIPELPIVNPSNFTEAQTQINADIPELPMVTPSNITEAQTQINDFTPELPMVTPFNITEAQTQIKDVTPELLMVTPSNVTEAQTQIKAAIPKVPMVTPSNVTEAQTQIKAAVPEMPMVTPSNITEAQTQIKAAKQKVTMASPSSITEAQSQIKAAAQKVPMASPSNITEAQTQIKAAIPEMPMVTPSNITEAQTQINTAIQKVPMVTPFNITEAQTQIKAAISELPMVTPSNITEAQTQIKADIQEVPMVSPSNITEVQTQFKATTQAQTQIKAATQKVPIVSPSNITAPQTAASVAAKGLMCPVIRLITPSKPSDTLHNKIIVVPRFSLMPQKKQHLSFASTVVTASLQSSSTAAGLRVGTPLLSSVSQKVRYVTSQKMLSIIPPRLTTTLKGQQPDFLHSRKLIVVPNDLSVVASEKHQSKSISHQSKTIAPTTNQESIEPADTLTLSSTKWISSSQNLSVHVDAQTAKDSPISSQKNNVSYTCGSPKQTASVSDTNAATETCCNSEMLLPSGYPEPSCLSPVENKLFPVVRLTRLPVLVSSKDTVSVSDMLSNGCPKSRTTSKNRATQDKSSVVTVTKPSEMPLVTRLKETTVFVSVHTPQTSEEKSNTQAVTLASSETSINVGESCVGRNVQTSLSSKVSSPGLDISTVTPIRTKPSDGEPTSNLEEELFSNVAQDCTLSNTPPQEEKRSTGLILLTSIPSKDASDPHLQMTKTQFLAQLAVTPAIKAPQKASSERDSSAETSTSGKRSSLISRLRSHFKVCLQNRKNETNSDQHKEADLTTVSPKIPKLENIEMTTSEKSGVEEDVAPPNKTAEDPIPNNPQRSKLSEDALRPNRSDRELIRRAKSTSKATSKSPRTTCSGQDCVGPKKMKPSSASPRRLSSANDLFPKRSSSTKKPEISAMPGACNLSETGVCFQLSTSNLISVSHTKSTSTQVCRPIKTESESLSPIRIPIGSENLSLSIKNEMDDGDCPKKTNKATPAKKPRMIQDVASSKQNLRALNAKKMATAKMIAKLKNSNQSKLQNGAKTSGEAMKTCHSKAVWIPPNVTQTKDGTLALLPIKKEIDSLAYLPSVPLNPIPIKAPPVVSPLEPLSVIGGRLLKNQCGECGRILSSNAALESHVSLHTGCRPFSCTLCGKGFSDSKSLKRHGRVHRNGKIHICHECGKGFVYRFSLSKHLQMVHRKIKPFVCQICRKSFFTRRDVESHIRTHTGEKPFECNLCDRKFTRRVELNVHLRWHNGEKRHWCTFCGKGFLDLNNLKRHKYIHTGEKPHSCPHCPKKFTQSAHLKKHVKNVHKVL
ncbi:mucin-2 isoform X2 [Solea solea]|nr:mucin-2 isoform X2 [Solea solea]